MVRLHAQSGWPQEASPREALALAKPQRGGQIIAPGEQSEPGVDVGMGKALKGRQKILSPFQGFTFRAHNRGFALLTPGYCLPPLRGTDQFHFHDVLS